MSRVVLVNGKSFLVQVRDDNGDGGVVCIQVNVLQGKVAAKIDTMDSIIGICTDVVLSLKGSENSVGMRLGFANKDDLYLYSITKGNSNECFSGV